MFLQTISLRRRSLVRPDPQDRAAGADQSAFRSRSDGFSPGEIDALLDTQHSDGEDADDIRPEYDPSHVVTQTGDCWRAGPHLLICGDAKADSRLGFRWGKFQSCFRWLGRSTNPRLDFGDEPFRSKSADDRCPAQAFKQSSLTSQLLAPGRGPPTSHLSSFDLGSPVHLRWCC